MNTLEGKPNLLTYEKPLLGPTRKKLIKEKGIKYGITSPRSEVVSLEGKLKGGKTIRRRSNKKRTKRRV